MVTLQIIPKMHVKLKNKISIVLVYQHTITIRLPKMLQFFMIADSF
jgi:hypothetical protein